MNVSIEIVEPTQKAWSSRHVFIGMPVALVEKQKAKAIKQAKKLLRREGLLPPDEPLAPCML